MSRFKVGDVVEFIPGRARCGVPEDAGDVFTIDHIYEYDNDSFDYRAPGRDGAMWALSPRSIRLVKAYGISSKEDMDALYG